MQMIGNTSNTDRFCVQVTADRRNVGLHARSNFAVQPWFAIFRAKDDMNDDLAEGLRHRRIIAQKPLEVNRAFSAHDLFPEDLGRCPRLI